MLQLQGSLKVSLNLVNEMLSGKSMACSLLASNFQLFFDPLGISAEEILKAELGSGWEHLM